MTNRCSICDPKCRYVEPTGPEPSDFLFIGEKPGREEAQRGRVFCGDTGTELDGLYLPLAGLSRREVRVTNVLKCRLKGTNAQPTPPEIAACGKYWLPGEIQRCQPKVIVLMGATACSLYPGIDLDRDHGLPILHTGGNRFFGDWHGWIWPLFHPAAGLHQTSLMIPLMEDFERIRLWARDKWSPPTAVPTDYALAGTDGLLGEPYPLDAWIPIDTEEDFSVQFSLRPGHGRMILTKAEGYMMWFRAWIKGRKILLHNALYDLNVLEQLGITGFEYRDTMQEAYHRGNLPQGLKALGWRLFGVQMQSWEDLVMPYSRKQAVLWLVKAWDLASDHRLSQTTVSTGFRWHRKKQMIVVKRPRTVRLVSPTELERDIKRVIRHSEKPDYDLWEKVEEARIDQEEVVEVLGPLPRPSIRHVPLDEAVRYGCQDADVTGRLGAWMDKREEVVVGEEDWDQ